MTWEVFMLLKKTTTVSILFAMLLIGLLYIGAPAQRRARAGATFRRTVVVRRVYYHRYYDPFWRGTLWDPYYWNDPYYSDPYLWERRTRYYKEKAVRDARRKLAKNREKYAADGYLTPKEREKLAKSQRKYSKAVASLNKYNRDR
jgi:hypothetical protein